MAYLRVTPYQTKSGRKWTVLEASKVVKGKKTEKKLTATVFRDLGFSENMSVEQARDHAKKLNALNKVKRKEQRNKVKASERLENLAIVEGSLISKELSAEFVSFLEDNWSGGLYNLRKHIQHWATVQKLIKDTKIQPARYFKDKKMIYKWFEIKQFSPSYIQKLLKVLNLWGEFYSDQTRSYFKRVPSPSGIILENIKEASKADGKGSTPMSLSLLRSLNGKLPDGQHEYLHCTLWLGLRPSELDNILQDPEKYLITKEQKNPNDKSTITVVGVYQSKLSGVSKDKRWKWIPLIHPDQIQALNYIQNKIPKKPLLKTIRQYLNNKDQKVGLYSGRKGFTDLMLDLGQELENISLWLGHSSIERTWRHYKSKEVIKFNPIKKIV